ncbi:TPM domain-containing protein [Paraflavitalea pollutisoli]|uniref:TPM domain-containing protein n=1 Tax=Paraflavitalea pollutisoli TaxID=3034143 RepID=UPI0023EA8E3B|nr:TPM domain-containing protein [Paraflavitalea sp. H1-2-19X]
MRNLFIAILFILSAVQAEAQEPIDQFVRPRPVKAKPVVDFARLLSPKESQRLIKDLTAYRKQSSNAIVIITLPTLTDPETAETYTIEEAAYAYFNTWGIGDSTKNNGVLILVVPSERKLRIEVGTGLEYPLTDDACQEIIDNQLVHNFKEQQYYQGLADAVMAIKQVLYGGVQGAEDSTTAATETSRTYETAAYEPNFVPIDSSFNYTGIAVTLAGLLVIGCFLYKIFNGAANYGSDLYSGRGYRRHYSDRFDDWPSQNDSHRSSSSSSSSSNSSSSSSSSYGGGSSSGGGASGSW